MMKQFFQIGSNSAFRTRSQERDANADIEAVRSIASAINEALNDAQAERAGLKERIDDVLARAAIVAGNDVDDYLTRTEDRSTMLSDSEAEIKRGEERLSVLDQNIGHFKFLKAALQTRFPNVKTYL